MTLRAIYRSYGGENRKDRPDWYSKLGCLLSFVRAAERAGVEPVFMNDGPVPEDRERVMRDVGPIVALPGVGMRGSYLTALRHAADGRWDPADTVWFSEDDYLYTGDSLVHLQRATDALPAQYFALYGSTPQHVAEPGGAPVRFPRGWRAPGPWQVDGVPWVRIRSTASTFGARVGALREDLGVFRFCMVPHRTMYRDHDTGLLLQGFEPYDYPELLRSAAGLDGGPLRDRVRSAWLAPFLLATNLRSHRRPGRRRTLVAADPNLATHVEDGVLAPGTDWAAVAAEVSDWAAGRGLLGSAA